jgi:hypothetical protein
LFRIKAGLAEERHGQAVELAKLPVLPRLLERYTVDRGENVDAIRGLAYLYLTSSSGAKIGDTLGGER